MEDYPKWSLNDESKENFVLVLFASAYGFTKRLAEESVDAINQSGKMKAKLLDVLSTSLEEIVEKISAASAILVGSCTINRDAPKVIWDVLASIDAINSRGKPAGVFGSYGWSGEAVSMISDRLKGLGFKLNENAIKANFMPTEEDLAKMRDYATKIALDAYII